MVNLSDFIKAYDVRGLVPEQINPQVARAIGAAFAQVIITPESEGEGSGALVIGYDMRPSSPELAQAFAAGAAHYGVDVSIIGLCSTDGLYCVSGQRGVPGAMFTASHNPAAYNGIKLCRAHALPVSIDTGLDRVRDLAQFFLDRGEITAAPEKKGSITHTDSLPDYAQFLRSLVDLRGGRHLKVVVDAANGMGGHTVPAVLGTSAGLDPLPLEIIPLYFELDGTFPNHEANPLDPKNLVDLQAAVREHQADIGLAFDGDADRCFVVDEQGQAVNASAITALVARREIARQEAAGVPAAEVSIVANLISSAAVPEIVREAGAKVVRTRVGHSYIKDEMAAADAVFGGEHSAHYYFRDFWFADTGMLAAMHVLAALGESREPLSQLVAAYNRYSASGEINSVVRNAAAATARVRAWAENWAADQGGTVECDELDGLTITHENDAAGPMWWLNVRASNTEPLLRLNVEAANTALMEQIRDAALQQIRAEEGATP